MSLLTVIFCPDVIVMSADSRVTTDSITGITSYNDSEQKIFLTSNKIGISTHGNSRIGVNRIETYIQEFIDNNANSNNMNVREVAETLLSYFQNLAVKFDSYFYVCGYQDGEKRCEYVKLQKGEIETQLIGTECNISFAGEIDVTEALINKTNYQIDFVRMTEDV